MESNNDSVGYEIPTETSRFQERKRHFRVQAACIAIFVGIICLAIFILTTVIFFKRVDSVSETMFDQSKLSHVIRSVSEKDWFLESYAMQV